MATYTKIKLSGSTDGKGIKVAATSIASGTTIHTAGASDLDLVTIYAYNSHSAAIVLTLGWGGTTTVDNEIIQSIPAQTGLTLVAADLPLTNSLIVKASSSSADKIVLYGTVNRIAA